MELATPVLMSLGHGRRHLDWAAVTAVTSLGTAWVLFVWSMLGQVLRLVLQIVGVENPVRSRIVSLAVVTVAVVLLVWGFVEAMRVPRVKKVDVAGTWFGRGLDGLRVAVITDTHYGPINRARWSAAVAARVNELRADIVCRVGDIADATVEVRENQAGALTSVEATSASRVSHRQPRVLQ